MGKDFYIEYYRAVEEVLDKYVTSRRLPSCVRTKLFEPTSILRDKYNARRLKGEPADILRDFLSVSLLPDGDFSAADLYPKACVDLSRALDRLRGCLILYIHNNRQLNYLRPVIMALNRPVLLLCEGCVDTDMDAPENVRALEIDPALLEETDVCPASVPLCLKPVRDYYTLLSSIVKAVEPEGIVVLEGCHYQEQILGDIAGMEGVPSMVIQQGWPSLMHTMFRKFPYSYFLAWGNRFSSLWQSHSPKPSYVPVGYPYPVLPKADTEAIAFFLQAPLFISDKDYFERMLSLIGDTADRYPGTKVLIREHPEYRLTDGRLSGLAACGNAELVSDWPLPEVFAHTRVAVSHFSSSVMESVAHGCVPVVFDPTSDSMYSPNIEELGIGVFSKNEDEFFRKLDRLMNRMPPYATLYNGHVGEWFEAVGDQALHNLCEAANRLAPVGKLGSYKGLNLGCGPHILPGWLNCDLFDDRFGAFRMDAGKPYPFPDDVFDFVFSEHMFEHLTPESQRIMLGECLRVLKPGGVLRLAMPNFHFLMGLYNRPDEEINRRYLKWSYDTFIKSRTHADVEADEYPVYVINNFMRNWGHKFIHTPQSVSRLAEETGFDCVVQCEVSCSAHEGLRNLESHQKSIPVWANALETFVVEMTKPTAAGAGNIRSKKADG